MKNYDVVVIGAGPGGYVAAIRGAQKGLTVAVIEYDYIGGTCLNRGCVPTKSIKHSAHLYSEILKSEEFGIKVEGASPDIDKIYDRKNGIVTGLRSGIEQLIKLNKIDHYNGVGTILDKNTISVKTDEGVETITTKNIIIATGGEPTLLPNGLSDKKNVLTSDDVLSDKGELYKRIVIIGGGVIGVEFAQIYNDLGSEVTLMKYSKTPILRKFDKEIAQNLTMILKKRGVRVLVDTSLIDIEEEADGLNCKITYKGEPEDIKCDAVLVCAGRKPVTKNLFGEGFEVEMERGFIKINENLQTNIENIYAIGDCTNSSFLAHGASAQGMNAISHIVGEKLEMDTSLVPECIYTDPEIACVGITADEAKEKGIEVKVGKFAMSGNAKTLIEGSDRSFIKLVSDANTGVMLGAQLMCPRATDLISELTLAIVNKLTAHEVIATIHPHPTFTEGVAEAAEDIYGMSVHLAPKKK